MLLQGCPDRLGFHFELQQGGLQVLTQVTTYTCSLPRGLIKVSCICCSAITLPCLDNFFHAFLQRLAPQSLCNDILLGLQTLLRRQQVLHVRLAKILRPEPMGNPGALKFSIPEGI